ncbi:TonB box-like [Candidatus Moduliflexus flocculans]|uniref:TonB box-like n=1 Tax=Candidatus Moduliflexus flocculans TaxID=1499966 RepID=A0A0S6VQW2_9BACT|nr:TonB box-like [Candidatus Moduliflexus flocculans]
MKVSDSAQQFREQIAGYVTFMRRIWIPGVCVVLCVIMVGGVVWYMQTSPRFEISRIGIRGHVRLTPQAIVEHLNLPRHTNIFHVRLHDIQQKVESLPWIRHADVFRQFPDKLSIIVTEREPFALVKLDELYLIDRDGVILGSLASGSAIRLPIITGSLLTQLNENGVSSQLQEAFHALDDVMQHPLLQHVRKIRLECSENVAFLVSDTSPEIRLSLKTYQQGLQRLEKIYADLPKDTLASIDLRFEKRIVVTQHKESQS